MIPINIIASIIDQDFEANYPCLCYICGHFQQKLFASIEESTSLMKVFICNECKYKDIKYCYFCAQNVYISISSLKKGIIFSGGRYALMMCKQCLKKPLKKLIGSGMFKRIIH